MKLFKTFLGSMFAVVLISSCTAEEIEFNNEDDSNRYLEEEIMLEGEPPIGGCLFALPIILE